MTPPEASHAPRRSLCSHSPDAWLAGGIAAAAPRAGDCAPQRVLVIDDEVDVLRGLSNMLVADGYRVTCATSLVDGAAAIRRQQFQLVLTDLYLGDTDLGVRIAEVARERRPHTPVIVLTGRPTFDGAQEALRRHVAD